MYFKLHSTCLVSLIIEFWKLISQIQHLLVNLHLRVFNISYMCYIRLEVILLLNLARVDCSTGIDSTALDHGCSVHFNLQDTRDTACL